VSQQTVRDIKRMTRKQYSAEEKIRIVLDGLRGEDSIAELCRREGIAQSLYYKWSKDFMEAGRARLAGVSVEDQQDLLGHRSRRMTTHHSAAELSRLIESANTVCGRNGNKLESVVLRRLDVN
jgi:transposase-like protein